MDVYFVHALTEKEEEIALYIFVKGDMHTHKMIGVVVVIYFRYEVYTMFGIEQCCKKVLKTEKYQLFLPHNTRSLYLKGECYVNGAEK